MKAGSVGWERKANFVSAEAMRPRDEVRRDEKTSAVDSDGSAEASGLGGPRGHGIAAGRIPPRARTHALPEQLVFVDPQGEPIEAPPGRARRADGHYVYRRDGRHIQLRPEAAAAFRALRAEALRHGVHLRLVDGFRPDDEQAARVARAETRGTSRGSAYVASAGESEHRTGFAFDLRAEARMPDGTRAREVSLRFAQQNAELFGINFYDGPPGERMHFSYNVR